LDRGYARIRTSENSILLRRWANKGGRKAEAAISPGPVSVANCGGLLLFGNEPELLHRAQIIVALPLLDYLAVLDAVHGEPFDLYLPASGRTE
jgi:hypothetical protein